MGCAECRADPVNRAGPSDLTIALVGNPNCGKTALFNALTGVRQKTGNWPGVTVDRKEGRFDLAGRTVTVVDLPGIYSLDADSLDERITRDYLLSGEADLFVNVVDASNLGRHLYLTVQLLEMEIPLLLAVNMMDVADRAGIDVDLPALAGDLGCPAIPVVATEHRGMGELGRAILSLTDSGHDEGFPLAHSEPVEEAISRLEPLIEGVTNRANARWLALKLLEGDALARETVGPGIASAVAEAAEDIEDRAGRSPDILIAEERLGHAHALADLVVGRDATPGPSFSDRIDRVVLSRVWGIPVFIAVMYAMFMFTINLGGAFVDFFDGLAGTVFVDGFSRVLGSIGAPDWSRVLLADGAGGGIRIVATFIPIIGALYLFLSFLEDSGYMARAAFVMDRAMRAIGLPGKAFVPMIVGFGCTVPAVMATRTLRTERERKLTILMNPFMSCGARLPVYALFAAAFFPANGQNVVFGLYVIGIAAAVATGLIMKTSLLPGESEGFMMELPSYHRPTLRGLLLRTRDRVRLFVGQAGRVIVVMVIALTFLNSLGTDGTFGNENTDTSALSAVGRSITPVLSPLGVHDDNWPATVGIFSGSLAKEVVVGTLDSLYGSLDGNLATSGSPGGRSEPNFDFWDSVGQALSTIPDGLRRAVGSVTDPIGWGVGDVTSSESAAVEQGVSSSTFGAMASRFDGRIGAFAYLLFILLYLPCVATLGAITREAGRPWAAFVALWTTGLAYLVATVFYQGATFGRHPLGSTLWIGGLVIAAGSVVVGLRRWARRGEAITPVAVSIRRR